MAVAYENSVGNIIVSVSDVEIVDKTILRSCVISLFQNLNTFHPNVSSADCLRLSRNLHFLHWWEFPSTSTATIFWGLPISTAYHGGRLGNIIRIGAVLIWYSISQPGPSACQSIC